MQALIWSPKLNLQAGSPMLFLITVTGSNGKTTTTSLIGHILKKNAGLDVCVAGNIGVSFAAALAEGDHAYFVLEISSFQLDDIKEFQPDIAILLNITRNHLDRYQNNFEAYTASKKCELLKIRQQLIV